MTAAIVSDIDASKRCETTAAPEPGGGRYPPSPRSTRRAKMDRSPARERSGALECAPPSWAGSGEEEGRNIPQPACPDDRRTREGQGIPTRTRPLIEKSKMGGHKLCRPIAKVPKRRQLPKSVAQRQRPVLSSQEKPHLLASLQTRMIKRQRVLINRRNFTRMWRGGTRAPIGNPGKTNEWQR